MQQAFGVNHADFSGKTLSNEISRQTSTFRHLRTQWPAKTAASSVWHACAGGFRSYKPIAVHDSSPQESALRAQSRSATKPEPRSPGRSR
jgi:hypothetical protein